MNYKVIAFDLDGTLTNSQKIISPKTKETIFKAMKKGAIVVLATGRPTSGVIHLAKELELDKYCGYILPFNGGKLISCKDNSLVSEYSMPQDIIKDLYDFAKSENLGIITYKDDNIITENPDNKYSVIEAKICNLNLKKVDDFKSFVDFKVPKCLMLHEPKILEKAEQKALEKFSDRLTIFRSEPFFLEFMPKGIDKSHALADLLKSLNLTKENLIACGDSYNDISMIKFAGLGVAMQNAREEVIKIADVIAGHNDEDGLVPIIEKYLL